MENAQLINLSRLSALQRQMDVIANNVANLNTTGFKAEEVLFQDYLSPTASAEEFRRSDRDIHFVLDDRSVANFNDGPLRSTGNQLDLAIKGEGFFVLQTEAGNRYSRDGSFTLNPDGQLVTHNGDLVLGEGGPIVLSPQDTQIAITSEGVVSGNLGEVGRLQIVRFDDPQLLGRGGNNQFTAPQGVVAQPIERPQVVQFALEGANVDPITGIARMIEVQRAYQELTNIMRGQNDLREQAISRLGRVETNG